MSHLTVDDALKIAIEHHRAGRFQEAESVYNQILAKAPDHPDALNLLGVLAADFKRHDIAIPLFTRAINVSPHFPNYYFNLANSLFAIGQLNDALTCYLHAIEINPAYPGAHYNIANTYRDLNNPQQALIYYSRAIEQDPKDIAAMNNIADVLQKFNRFEESLQYYKQALAINPDFPATLSNIANAYLKIRDYESAIKHYSRAIELHPRFPEPYNGIGNTLMQFGRLDEAVEYLEKAIAIRPDYAIAYNNLGSAYKEIGQLDQSLDSYRKSISLDPTLNTAHSNLLLTLLYSSKTTPELLAEESQKYDEQFGKAGDRFTSYDNLIDPNRKLRIGYISPDFRNHPVGRFMLPLVRRHDKLQFEIFCYAFESEPDEMQAQFQSSADHWRQINTLNDNQLCDLIRADQIDILVDLSLHLANNRLLVFARHPAPVQLSFAGYPGSTGLSAIDYHLTDPYLEPPGMFDKLWSDSAYRLPHTFWCDDLDQPLPDVSQLPAKSNGFITFGSLNNFCKVNADVLDAWIKILSEIPDSRFIMLAPESSARNSITDIFQSAGISPDRIEFVGKLPREEYLKVYNRIDIGLDSFPYNGHATSFDALVMGVPVVTLVGKTIVGRAGLSLLTNLQLTDLIAFNTDDYVKIAAQLADNLDRLETIRCNLRKELRNSPLGKIDSFTQDIESAYRTFWQNWCTKRPSFSHTQS